MTDLNEIWVLAEKHWPAMVNRERTELDVIKPDRRPDYIKQQERQAAEEHLVDLPENERWTSITYELEPVGEFFEMAYDPIMDRLFVKDMREHR